MHRFDYLNGFLVGRAAVKQRDLQVAQSYAVRAITGLRMRDHITPAPRELHWLPAHRVSNRRC